MFVSHLVGNMGSCVWAAAALLTTSRNVGCRAGVRTSLSLVAYGFMQASTVGL